MVNMQPQVNNHDSCMLLLVALLYAFYQTSLSRHCLVQQASKQAFVYLLQQAHYLGVAYQVLQVDLRHGSLGTLLMHESVTRIS